MSEAFIGQVVLFAGPFAPRNWHFCDGSIISIQQNAALFSILGTVYGGNGSSTFALPDLRGRVPVGAGSGPGLSPWNPGQANGTENVTLNTNQMPTHNHNLVASSSVASTGQPGNNFLGQANDGQGGDLSIYSTAQTAAPMGNGSIGAAGGGQGHPNIQPSLGMNYIICTQGIFPQRN